MGSAGGGVVLFHLADPILGEQVKPNKNTVKEVNREKQYIRTGGDKAKRCSREAGPFSF